MFDPLDEDKKRKIYIYIYFFFYENDTNEVKGSYHDDCLEKRKQNIFCILNWRLAAPEI